MIYYLINKFLKRNLILFVIVLEHFLTYITVSHCVQYNNLYNAGQDLSRVYRRSEPRSNETRIRDEFIQQTTNQNTSLPPAIGLKS